MRSALLAIWQADSGFPNGSFAFSYGLEAIADLRGKLSPRSLADLIESVLRQRWASFDRVLMMRAFRAGNDLACLAELDRLCEAMSLLEPHRLGSRRNGGSFIAAHARLGNPVAARLRDAIAAGACIGHLPTMQGAVWRALQFDAPSAQLASGYITASGMVAAAVRLGAIGALQAQSALQSALPIIDELVTNGDDDAEPSSCVPFVDIVAARHMRADLRLFAN
ncbi:urease accessory UreF family protein [Rhodopseudomonas sp. BR0M22]|uniref:urease accessory protein UreF n=1 Tax=Rhodopseudomonas sp. BR0M22 TaxID=2269369 RepID=UPI0013E08CBD|nr:urease accessory UreF family protein [Rhodopseudomonas sp. BR0M22]NEW93815.1 urease accessory protein UreF [Rhodopseudomonas sp. BR0M22]